MKKHLIFILLFIACLYPSIAMAHYQVTSGGEVLLLVLSYLLELFLRYCVPVLVVILLLVFIIKITKRSIRAKENDLNPMTQFQGLMIHGSPSDLSKDYTISEIRSLLEPIFSKYKIFSAELLGDYATGQATSDSSVDILVDCALDAKAIHDFHLEIIASLGKTVNLLDARMLDVDLRSKLKTHSFQIYG